MSKYPIELDDEDITTNVGEPLVISPEVEALADRPYRLIVWQDDENGWVGQIPELPGHIAAADTAEEMLQLAEDAKRAWIAAALRHNDPIPDPRAPEAVPMKSGKYALRMPPTMHAVLSQEAERQGVSLNELIVDTLALVVAKGFDSVVRAVAESNVSHQ